MLVGAIVLAACGTASPAGSGEPNAESAAAKSDASVDAPDGGDVLTADGIKAAFAALEAQGSWMFEATVLAGRTGSDLVVTGTERRQPGRAVAAQHSADHGDFGYIRIGDDIWFDVGTGEWTQVAAADGSNLIDQYEPFHLAALVEFAAAQDDDYAFVADEDVNGVPSRHYRVSDADREDLAEKLGLLPEQWAADVWIAADGGYLVRYVWGPTSFEAVSATGGVGFVYDASDFGCSCPVEPPT